LAEVPQFDLPFRVEAGAVVEVDQDAIEDIDNCVEAIVRTPLGSHIDDLDLGVPDLTFRSVAANPSAQQFLAAIEEQEPRAHLLGEARLEELRTLYISIRSAA
jgi:phage baseplate assembly protein W